MFLVETGGGGGGLHLKRKRTVGRFHISGLLGSKVPPKVDSLVKSLCRSN